MSPSQDKQKSKGVAPAPTKKKQSTKAVKEGIILPHRDAPKPTTTTPATTDASDNEMDIDPAETDQNVQPTVATKSFYDLNKKQTSKLAGILLSEALRRDSHLPGGNPSKDVEMALEFIGLKMVDDEPAKKTLTKWLAEKQGSKDCSAEQLSLISKHVPTALNSLVQAKEKRRETKEAQKVQEQASDAAPPKSGKTTKRKRGTTDADTQESKRAKAETATAETSRFTQKQVQKIQQMTESATTDNTDADSTDVPSRQIWVPKPRKGSKFVSIEEFEVIAALNECEQNLVKQHQLEGFSFRAPDVDASRSRGIVLTFEDADLAKRVIGFKATLRLKDQKCPFTYFKGGGILVHQLTSVGSFDDGQVASALTSIYGKNQLSLYRIYNGNYFLKAYWVTFVQNPRSYVKQIPLGGLVLKDGKPAASQKFAYLDPKKEGQCKFCGGTHEGICPDSKIVLGINLRTQ